MNSILVAWLVMLTVAVFMLGLVVRGHSIALRAAGLWP